MYEYRNGRLLMDGMPLAEIAARYGTPCYVYSRADIEAAYRAYDEAFGTRPHHIHYAVKANANLAVLNLLARLGSGFDIVSAGELARVLAARGSPRGIVFSGVGKTIADMEAALAADIDVFNVESAAELERLDAVAGRLGRRARIAVRVNPDVDARTHPYISTGLDENKFGVPMADALEVYRTAARRPHLEVVGVACHIGSQLTTLAPFADAMARIMVLVGRLVDAGIPLAHVDAGGGLGIRYRDETPPAVADYVATLCRAIPPPYEIHIEPGRSLVGAAGVLLTTVEYLKRTPKRHFAIVDAAMNDLIRPALYEAWHEVLPLEAAPGIPEDRYDLVGPVCESGDFLAQDRALRLRPGTRLAVLSAGAYGHVMASNYNARPRPPEVIVDGGAARLVRPRESLAALYSSEVLLPDAP
ncbi:MAG TPA: diaminopimelate decarboxylase [Gammaproteobacteria bacterium]|nr:diaminopimelate decarboxylase [Gammaproteobacteria bacterium]